MERKKYLPRTFPGVCRLVRMVYKAYEIRGAENLPREASFVIANHAQIHGPLFAQLYLPEDHHIWCAAEVMDMKTAQPYAYKDFWSGKPGYIRWLYKLLSYVAAPLLVYIHTNARTVGVYHDHRVMSTFRETLRLMEEGKHMVIFPEKAEPNNGILCQFQEGFVDAARLLHRRTGRRAAFVPMYIAPSLKTAVYGEPVYYNEENPLEEERARICREMTVRITALAKALPAHVVTPYMNVSKKEYPMSK